MQDYTNQSLDGDSMAFCDARVDVTIALYELAFNEKHDVELGPALMVTRNPPNGLV